MLTVPRENTVPCQDRTGSHQNGTGLGPNPELRAGSTGPGSELLRLVAIPVNKQKKMTKFEKQKKKILKCFRETLI